LKKLTLEENILVFLNTMSEVEFFSEDVSSLSDVSVEEETIVE